MEILPVFLIAVICSSLIDLYLPNNYFEKIENNFIGDSKFKASLGLVVAAVLGALIPICTCGMIPLAIGLLKKKLNWKFILAFLLAGNACSISALILNLGVLGWESTLWRFNFAVLFAVINVLLFSLFYSEAIAGIIEAKLAETEEKKKGCCGPKVSKLKKIWSDLKETSLQFLPWIIFAVLVASLMHFNHDFVLTNAGALLQNELVSPFFMSLIAFPLYLCAGADVAMSAEFLDLGVALGSVLAFMTASPGVNFTTLVVYKQAFDIRVAVALTVFPVLVISFLGVVFNLLT
ncbi:MAG: permease [Candidatus Caenarcaniphilales bacterium]|nr:permease [Candidatus Caenarcaniphilales bacterium]